MAAAIGRGRVAADEREVVITRLIDAPRELVFAAWTDPRHVAHWWRPKALAEVRLEEMEVRPGGLLRFTMITTERATINSRCTYREITAPERLSYDETCDQDGKVFHRAHHAITFEAQAGKTLLTLHARLELVPDLDPRWTLEMMRAGWTGGWNDNLDLLDGYLPRATFLETPGKELILRRLIQAPRELVFRAWSDPAQLAQWWGPKAFTNPVCEGDLKVGGAWRIVMRGPDGADYPLSGAYLEIAPPERLVMRMSLDQHPREFHERIAAYRAAHPADDAGYDGEIVMALTLEQKGGATWMTMRQRFGSAAERNAHRDMGAIAGWSESFERLDALVAGART
jgi:uncharacterized protein YndB with AHSA1/START domain